jgi:hypothetical protein
MKKEEIKIIETLLFYASMLDNKQQTEGFQEQLINMGITYDYYYRALEKAREILESNKQA